MGRTIRIIGVPIDLGQSRRGLDMGPGALRYAGLAEKLQTLGHKVMDSGNLDVPGRESISEQATQHYLPAIAGVCRSVYHTAELAIANGETPVFIGGDHTLAIGSIGGITATAPAGVLWIDAHADFNTPQTTITGNIHGMSLAVLLGEGARQLVDIGRPGAKLHPEDVVLIAVRNIDSDEKMRLRESGVTVYTMRDIDERGIGPVIREALQRLEHQERIHVSLDLDSLDPGTGPGVGTRAPGGLTYREAQLAMEIISDCDCCCSLDVVEINPILDHHNCTALLATELAASLFGKRIL